MNPIQGKNVTSMDVAKFLGVEKEYTDVVNEQEVKHAFENFKKAEVEDIIISENSKSDEEPK